MLKGYDKFYDAEARLIILRALDEDTGKRMNESMLHARLQFFGINKTRDYLRTQLMWLAEQAGAVSIMHATETVMIVQLKQAGADHLSRTALISGVKEPSLER